MNIDSTMKELAEYIRMGEEIAANIDALKDALKQYMREKIGRASCRERVLRLV